MPQSWYALEIGILAALFLAQSLVIAALLVQRRKRLRAVRDLSSRLLRAQEDEWRRVAGELHDDVGQRIVAASLAVSAVKRGLSQDHEATERLQRALGHLNSLAHSVRAVSHQLHPVVLERCGLEDALRSQISDFATLTGIDVDFRSNCETVIPEDVALCLFRISQEALQNVAKHANATHVLVSLSRKTRALQLTICDNGVGFDRKSIRTSAGLGLISMNERARLLSGRIGLRSRRCGSILSVRIPISSWTRPVGLRSVAVAAD